MHTEPTQETILGADSLRAGYGEVRVLRDVSFSLAEGEVLSIVGPNGAGKTTLMRSLMGLLSPDDGSITVAGDDVTDAEPHERVERGLSLVSEGRNLFREMTVEENLRLGAYRSRDRVRSELERVYDLFPRLDERRSQRAGTLSGGEAQMLAIGRGLMTRPRVLLLDEPSLGLAPLLVPELFEKVAEINAADVSVVLVEQRARKALSVADRGCLLENGEISHRADAAAMLDDQQVIEKYLGGR
jgi:branched-chain amino acid transport system ATP-binding protein